MTTTTKEVSSVLLALTLFACGSAPHVSDSASQVIVDPAAGHDFTTTVEGQAEALAVIWYQTYGLDAAPPRIEWIPQSKLTCWFDEGFIGSDGSCVRGEEFDKGFYIQVAMPSHWTISDTALAHELFHAHEWLTKHDQDSSHASPQWTLSQGMVNQAGDDLRAAGL